MVMWCFLFHADKMGCLNMALCVTTVLSFFLGSEGWKPRHAVLIGISGARECQVLRPLSLVSMHKIVKKIVADY